MTVRANRHRIPTVYFTGIRKLSNKAEIEKFLRNDPALHIYSIGDLDDFFWEYTSWFGWYEQDQLSAVLLLYQGTESPVLLALENSKPEAALNLIKAALPDLPKRFYSHLSPHLSPFLREYCVLEHHGLHQKMSLRDPAALQNKLLPQFPTRHLTNEDLPLIRELYKFAYLENWFDQRMLETGKYVGAFHNAQLVAIAGIHVFSKKYRVAALGNITTLPALRGKGLGAHVTAWLCNDLLKDVDLIGLNVKADNRQAIRCYEKLGFELDAEYEEFMVSRLS